jgi:hypothetical protein
MMNRWERFNIYLLVTAAVAAAVACGCQSTTKEKPAKLLSTFRLHLAASRDGTTAGVPVPVYRQNPIIINVEKEPFLTEGNVAEAKVIDVVGGFALQIRFDGAGTSLLEQCTAANRGRKIVVFSQFGEQIKDARWLAAPVITRRINDGVLTFTPDATREEAEEIALGLNNVAKKVQ